MDSVKQSAALCLLRLYRTSPDLVPMGDWTSRVVHLLNDQHLVGACRRALPLQNSVGGRLCHFRPAQPVAGAWGPCRGARAHPLAGHRDFQE